MIRPVKSLAGNPLVPVARYLGLSHRAKYVCGYAGRFRSAVSDGVASISSTDMLHDYGAHFSNEIVSPTSRYRRTIGLNGEPSWMT